jgi:outer membrane protein
MKFPIISTFAVAATALVSTVQAELKVASVDVNELYTKFYKRFDTEVRLKEYMAEIKTEVEKQQAELVKLRDEAEALRKQYDPSRSEKEIAALRQKLQNKQNELQAKENQLKEYAQTRERAFQELYRRDLAVLFTEVQKVIEEESALGAYDLVIDSSAMNAAPRTKIFPYVKETFDITPKVLKKLNAGAPAGFDPDAELKKAGINLPK